MKQWKEIVLYVGAFLLQPFLYHILPGGGISPNLILILTAMLSFLYEDNYLTIGLGVSFALMTDLCYGLYVGPGAISVFIVAMLIFSLKDFANKENIINAGIVMLLSTWVYSSSYWLIYFIVGNGAYSYIFAMKSLPLQLLYNLIIALILYMILIKKVIRHRRDRYFR